MSDSANTTLVRLRTQDGHQRNGKEQPRKREQDIDQTADRLVHVTAEVPRNRPESDPDGAEMLTTTRPTMSEMRAPHSTRAKMSLPSSSRPNQCVTVGPSRRSASSCAAGSKRQPRPDNGRKDSNADDPRTYSCHGRDAHPRTLAPSRRRTETCQSYRIRGSRAP